jgi:hypothetical protein
VDLQQKYSELINFARNSIVKDLSVTEKNNVLYISGTSTPAIKQRMWEIYGKLDPDMRAGDLVMNIQDKPGNEEFYEIVPGDNLSKIAKRYPGMTWQKIYEANKDIIKNPDKIYPGQKIKIPL